MRKNSRPGTPRSAAHQRAVLENRARKTTVEHRLIDRTNRTRAARTRSARAEYGY